MEIGHVFQLGRKYAEALGLKVLDENGKLVTVTMGSYGIGVTRILAILAEDNHDEKGLVWPASVAPFDVHVVATGKDRAAFDAAETIVGELEASGLDVLFDDRPKVSPGVKFGDAELIGVPKVVIAGRGVADGVVEVWNRASGDRVTVPIDGVAAALLVH
jgi:prolyl-tRNA synthetase